MNSSRVSLGIKAGNGGNIVENINTILERVENMMFFSGCFLLKKETFKGPYLCS